MRTSVTGHSNRVAIFLESPDDLEFLLRRSAREDDLVKLGRNEGYRQLRAQEPIGEG